MRRLPALFHWLAAAAILDWFLLRTATRVAVHIPRSETAAAVFQAISLVGQIAGSVTVLLALAALGWIAWCAWQVRRPAMLSLVLCSLMALSLLFLVSAPSGWLTAANHLLSLAAIALIVGRLGAPRAASGIGPLPYSAALVPAAAVALGLLYQLAPAWYEALRWPGPPPAMGLFFHLGELLVVVSAPVWWAAYGRGASRRAWLLAAVPALVFTLSYLRDPAMTGVLAIWSTGLSLYLPWPLYAASLWLAGVTIAAAWRQHRPVSLALLLLLAGGYVPQLSAQLFISLAALWLLTEAALSGRLAPGADRLPAGPENRAGERWAMTR